MATPQSLLKDISAGKFKPTYYFYGFENYRVSEAVKYVTHQFLPDSQLKVNYIKLDGKRIKATELITRLANLPMLGDKQVFAITDFQSFKPTEVKQILSLLSPPDPNRIVIFTSSADKTPKKNSVFFKAVSVVAEAIEFKQLNSDESRRIISSKLHKNDLTILPDALNLLVELIAGNRGALESEITKLIDYKSSGESISVDDVKQVCHGFQAYSLFEMADYIVSGNTVRVLQMTASLLAEGISEVLLTTLIQQHFTSVYLVKNGKKPLGNRGFLVYKFRQQAQKYSSERLEKIIIDIAKTDSNLRQTGMSPKTTFEALVLTLCKQS